MKAIALLQNVLDSHDDVISGFRTAITIRSVDHDSINYALKFFVSDFSARNRVRTEIFSSIWYSIERAGYAFPSTVVDLRTARSKRQVLEKRQQISWQESFKRLR